MADTIRTTSSLLTLLANNVTGEISAQDLRDLLVSVHGVYGMIYTTDGSSTTSVTGSYGPISGFSSDGPMSGIGSIGIGSLKSIDLTVSGVYVLHAELSYTVNSAVELEFSFYNDAILSGSKMQQLPSSTTDVQKISLSCIATLNTSTVSFGVITTGGSSVTLTAKEGNFCVRKIG